MFDFETYLETHFEVVSYIERYMLASENDYDVNTSAIIDRHKAQGHGGLYELAKEWTDEFQSIHENTEFDGDWLDTIDEYLANKNKTNKF